MSESDIQKEIRKYMREQGILCERIQSGMIRVGAGYMHLASTGHPDLVCYLRGGNTLFLEIKGPKGKLSPDQVEYHERLTLLGHIVYTISSLSEAKNLLLEFGYV